LTTAAPPRFRLRDSALITIAVGRAAHNLRELRDRIIEVPAASFLHHFFEGLLRPSFDDPEFRNDFARWSRDVLRDDVLAERLGVIDPFEMGGEAEALRARLLDVVEDRLAEVPEAPSAPLGHEFQFLRSQIVIFDSGTEVRAPAELADLMPTMSPGSIFYHFVDAQLRPPLREDDFSAWLAHWGEPGQAARRRLLAIDPMFGSLRELRVRIAEALAATVGGRP
jgi:hypothetical protein